MKAIHYSFILLAVLVLVGQAGATIYDFQNEADTSAPEDWVKTGGSLYINTAEFTDTFCLHGEDWGSSSTWMINAENPTNYWAFTHLPYGGGYGITFFKSGGGAIVSLSLPTMSIYDRVEIIRSSNTYKTYINGALYSTSGYYADVPYCFGFYIQSSSFYVDDVVVGTSEEHNVIGCPPQTWFVAKDIFDGGFSGLYDVVDHQISASTMHVSYATDDGSATVTVTGPGGVVDTRTVSSYAGIITYNLTTMLFNSGAPYGQYTVAISGSTASDTFWYKAIATSGTSVEWDDTDYEDGDTATITFSISESNWVTDDYSYELRILNSDLDEMWSTGIGARPIGATQEISVTSSIFPITDTYYATIYATDLSSGEEILLVYDDAYIYSEGSGVVNVEGITYIATNSTIAGGANVSATQLGVPHYNTSDISTGQYEIENLITDWSIGMNASLSGYESYSVYFTPLAGGTYNVSIALVPIGGPQPGAWYDVTGGMMTADSSSNVATDYWNASLNGTSVGGLIYEAPYWSVSSGALVNLSNATWSNTVLTTAGGWYQFDNLSASQYTLSVSKSGYATTSGTVTPLENYFTRKDAYIDIEYTLTVNAKDISSLGLITGDTVTISLSTGQSSTTTTGSVTFTGLSYNVYDIVASCDGYYAGYSTIILDDDMTVDVYLQSMGDLSGPASNYVPHPVRFTYVDAYGNPITGATVTANAQESTNPWGWLSSVFGFNTNLTDINTTLTGTTGHDGTLSFLMVETVQYRVNCVKTISGINHTVDIYPKESEYFIRIGSLPLVGSYPTYSLNATTVGGNVVLFGNYTDTSGSSSGVRFIVRNSTSEVYNTSVTLTGGVGSASYAVNNTKGTQLTFGITSEHATQGHIEKWIDITLKGAGRLVDFGSGWTDFMYLAMSLAGIFLVAGCFGEIDVRLGAIFIPITGGIFWFIGWMGETYGLLIMTAGVLGVLYYMRSKAKELDT